LPLISSEKAVATSSAVVVYVKAGPVDMFALSVDMVERVLEDAVDLRDTLFATQVDTLYLRLIHPYLSRLSNQHDSADDWEPSKRNNLLVRKDARLPLRESVFIIRL
jgi:hypothetical protein